MLVKFGANHHQDGHILVKLLRHKRRHAFSVGVAPVKVRKPCRTLQASAQYPVGVALVKLIRDQCPLVKVYIAKCLKRLRAEMTVVKSTSSRYPLVKVQQRTLLKRLRAKMTVVKSTSSRCVLVKLTLAQCRTAGRRPVTRSCPLVKVSLVK